MKKIIVLIIVCCQLGWAQNRTITAAEYFWGTIDPGNGNGTALTAEDGVFNEALENVVTTYINSQTTIGPILFNIRIKDANNQWGPTFKKVDFNLSNATGTLRQVVLTKFEYFFGNFDPGEGACTTIVAFDGALDEAVETVFRSQVTWDVASGPILFNIRAKDSDGRWGSLFKKTIFPYGANLNPNLVQEGDALQICANSAVTLNYAGPNGFTPTWFDGTHGQSITFIPTAAGDYSVSATLENTTYTDAINITYKPLPTAAITPSGQVLVCGSSNFNLVANSGSGLSYQWLLNGNAIVSATKSNYLPTTAGSYTIKVTDSSSGCIKTSDATVLSSSFLMSPNGTNSFCGSQLISVPSGSSNGYQWKKDGVNISGATSASYSATTSGNYTCVITNGACSSTTAATILNTTNAGTINGTQSICTGGTATFTSNGTSGGTWTSSDTSKATINASTGVITPVAAGTSTIKYAVIG